MALGSVGSALRGAVPLVVGGRSVVPDVLNWLIIPIGISSMIVPLCASWLSGWEEEAFASGVDAS